MTSRKAECQLESLSRPVSLPTRSPAHHSSKLLTRTARGNSQGAKNNRQQPDLQLLAFGEKDMDDDAPGCSLMEAAFAATLKHENQTFVASVQLQPGLYYSLPSPVGIVCLHCVRRSQLDALWTFHLGKLFLVQGPPPTFLCIFDLCACRHIGEAPPSSPLHLLCCRLRHFTESYTRLCPSRLNHHVLSLHDIVYVGEDVVTMTNCLVPCRK